MPEGPVHAKGTDDTRSRRKTGGAKRQTGKEDRANTPRFHLAGFKKITNFT